jgi:hypothetical protein
VGGDGVRGRVVSNRGGLHGPWHVTRAEMTTDVPRIEVQAGDTLDFVVDCVGDVNCDSFDWVVRLGLTTQSGQAAGDWDSSADFHGPLRGSLTRMIAYAWQLAYQRPASAEELEWASEFVAEQYATLPPVGDRELAVLTNLCQQLLASNEFLYVD